MTDFTNRNEATRWLETKPREIGIVFAARAALRVAPMLVLPFTVRKEVARIEREIVLPTIRAMAASWVSARYSRQELANYSAAVIADAAAKSAARAADAADTPDFGRAISVGYTARAAAAAAYAVAANTSARAAAAAHYAARAAVDGSAFDGSNPSSNAPLSIADAYAADAEFIDQSPKAATLAERPLWLTSIPTWARNAWIVLDFEAARGRPGLGCVD